MEHQPRRGMTPRTVLTVSAASLATVGVALLFFPREVAQAIGLVGPAEVPLQLFAGGLFGMASLNWMGRGAIYGGIYGRPIVVANFGFGMITTTTLTSAYFDGALVSWSWTLAVASALHALAFWRLMRAPPWVLSESTSPSGDSAAGSA